MRAAITDRRLEAIAGPPVAIVTGTRAAFSVPAGSTIVAVGILGGGVRENLVHIDTTIDGQRYNLELLRNADSQSLIAVSSPGGYVNLIKGTGPGVAGALRTPVPLLVGAGGGASGAFFLWQNAFAVAAYPSNLPSSKVITVVHWLAQRYQIPM